MGRLGYARLISAAKRTDGGGSNEERKDEVSIRGDVELNDEGGRERTLVPWREGNLLLGPVST